MPANGCPETHVWKAFAQGDLAPGAIDELDRHLVDCPRCQDDLATLDGFEDALLVEIRGAGRRLDTTGNSSMVPADEDVSPTSADSSWLEMFDPGRHFVQALKEGRCSRSQVPRPVQTPPRTRPTTDRRR